MEANRIRLVSILHRNMSISCQRLYAGRLLCFIFIFLEPLDILFPKIVSPVIVLFCLVTEEESSSGGRRNSAGSVDGNSNNSQNNSKPSSTSLTVLQEKMRDAMKKLLNTRTVHGCPVNFPFTDVEEILQKVRLTIHRNGIIECS